MEDILVGVGVVLGTALVYVIRKFKLTKKLDDRCNFICWPMADRLKCNRIFIFKYHNGKHYTGDHRQRMTMIFEIAVNERPMKMFYQDIVVSDEAHRVMLHLQHRRYFYFETFSHAHEDMRDRYKSLNIHSMYLFPIKKDGKIRYSVSLCWDRMKYLDQNEIELLYREVSLIGRVL